MTNIIISDILLSQVSIDFFIENHGEIPVSELMPVLDYILNRCSAREIDAVEAAVKRRRQDLGEGSIDPARFAASMSGTIHESINSSITGLQENLKDFAWDLVKKENPNLTDGELEHIVTQMIPDILASKQNSSAADAIRKGQTLVVEGKVNGFPKDAMLEMVFQFIRYSKGTIPPEEDRALKNALGDWTRSYWKAFPPPLQDLLRSYLKETIASDAFEQALSLLLS